MAVSVSCAAPYPMGLQHQSALRTAASHKTQHSTVFAHIASCSSMGRKIVYDACCGSCMVFFLRTFTYRAFFTTTSILDHQSTMLNGYIQARQPSWRRYSRSKCGSRQQSSGGRALSISSLAKHTLVNDRWRLFI
jgi:hypothetical protein